MPNFKQCLAAGRSINWKARDELQLIHLDFICRNPFNITKGTRQWGKTHDHSLHGYSGLTIDEPLGIGMPTLAQGSRIIANSVSKMMNRFERLPGNSIRREQDNQLYKEWSGDCEVKMGVISMHETGDQEKQGKATEGWTFQNVKFDEGHLCGTDIYEKVLPTTDSFAMFGKPINIGILGVGGYSQSLIETKLADNKSGYVAMRIIPDLDNKYVPKGQKFIVNGRETIYNVLEYWPYGEDGQPCPKLGDIRRQFYIARHAAASDRMWSQFYLCETQYGGDGLIFPKLSKGITLPTGCGIWHEAGIDPGGGGDPTALAIFETARNYTTGEFYGANLIEYHELQSDDFEEQAKWAWELLDRYQDSIDYRRVIREANGLGKFFRNEFTKHRNYQHSVGFHTHDQGSPAQGSKGIKTLLIEKLMEWNLAGKFGCPDETAYKKLSNLAYSIDDAGKYDWPHSDCLSTCWVWCSSADSARGI